MAGPLSRGKGKYWPRLHAKYFTFNASCFIFLKKNDPMDVQAVSRDICCKVFIVFSICLAAVVVVTGVLALMSIHEALPAGVNSMTLSAIGQVNSCLMIGGGFVLFVLGIFTWACALKPVIVT